MGELFHRNHRTMPEEEGSKEASATSGNGIGYRTCSGSLYKTMTSSKQSKIPDCQGIGAENQRKAKRLEERMSTVSCGADGRRRHGDPVPKRKRHASDTLRVQFEWASWDGDVAYCNPCSLAKGEMKIVNRSDNKVHLFKQHEKTAIHVENSHQYGNKKFIPKTERCASPSCTETPCDWMQRIGADQFALVLAYLRTCGSTIGLTELFHEMNRILCTEKDRHQMNHVFQTTSTLWHMVYAMDRVIKGKSRCMIQEAEYAVITMNSASDFINVGLRLWMDGSVMHLFLGVVRVDDDMTTYDRAQAVLYALEDFTGHSIEYLSSKSVVVSGTFGAVEDGMDDVLKHMKTALPYTIPKFCTRHTLASIVIENVPSFKYICNVMKEVVDYFSNSALRTLKLVFACKELDLQLGKICDIIDDIRTSERNALYSFCRILPGLLYYFDRVQDEGPEAKCMFMQLTDFTTLWEIFLYLPLLDRLIELTCLKKSENEFFDDRREIKMSAYRWIEFHTTDIGFKGFLQSHVAELFKTGGQLFDVYGEENPLVKIVDSNGDDRWYFKRRANVYPLHFNRLANEEQGDVSIFRTRAVAMLELLGDNRKSKDEITECMLPGDEYKSSLKEMQGTAAVVTQTAAVLSHVVRERFPASQTLYAFNILSPYVFLHKDAENVLVDYTQALAAQFGCVTCAKGERCSCNPLIKRYLLYREIEEFIYFGVRTSKEYVDMTENHGQGPLHFLKFLLGKRGVHSKFPEYIKLLKLITTIPLKPADNKQKIMETNITEIDIDSRENLDEKQLNACLRTRLVPQKVWKVEELYTNLCIPASQEWSQSTQRRQSI